MNDTEPYGYYDPDFWADRDGHEPNMIEVEDNWDKDSRGDNDD